MSFVAALEMFLFGRLDTQIPKFVFVAVGITIAEIIRQISNYLNKKRSKKKIHQVIFFPDKSIACNDFFDTIQGCSRTRCEFSHETTGFRFVMINVSVLLSLAELSSLYFQKSSLIYQSC